MSGKNPDAAKQCGEATDKSFGDKPAPDSNEGKKAAPCDKDKTHWFAVRVEDDKGKLVKDVKVKLKLSDGSVQTVDLAGAKLSLKGLYKVDGLPSGTCDVSFPEVPDKEWNAKA